MIRLTRLNQVPLVVNADLIEHIEMTPDTVISLTTGQKFMVRETSDQVVQQVISFRRSILNCPPVPECLPASQTVSQPINQAVNQAVNQADDALSLQMPLRISTHGK